MFFPICLASMFHLAATTLADLDTIGREISWTWRDGGPATYEAAWNVFSATLKAPLEQAAAAPETT